MQTIEQLQARIERIDERLECWYQKPQTEKRIAKIERQEARRDRLYGQIAAIEEREAAAVERALPLIDEVTGEELPKDSFGFRVGQTDWGVSVFVDIYDSPFDDRFTGGEPLWLRASATGKRTSRGTHSHHTTLSLANGEYWTGESFSQTLVSGSSWWADWPEHSHLALTLAKDRELNFVLETADYTTAELFG